MNGGRAVWRVMLMHFFTLGSSKIGDSETYFFDTVTTQNHHPRDVKHVLGSIYVFSPYLGIECGGGGGGLAQGLGIWGGYRGGVYARLTPCRERPHVCASLMLHHAESPALCWLLFPCQAPVLCSAAHTAPNKCAQYSR